MTSGTKACCVSNIPIHIIVPVIGVEENDPLSYVLWTSEYLEPVMDPFLCPKRDYFDKVDSSGLKTVHASGSQTNFSFSTLVLLIGSFDL